MPRRRFQTLVAVSGLAGVAMLMISFSINAGPPADATVAQLAEFARQNLLRMVWGAWLQAVGTVLTVIFAFALVFLADATNRFAGWLTFFGGGVLTTVSLVEIVFYFGALFSDPLLTNRSRAASAGLRGCFQRRRPVRCLRDASRVLFWRASQNAGRRLVHRKIVDV